MTRDELYEKLGLRLQSASEQAGVLEPVPAGIERIFDLSMWIGVITSLIEIVRGCRSPETAKASVKEGGVASYRAMLQVGRTEKGYRGRELRNWAWKATQEARTITDEEWDGIITDSKDLPTPPPVDGGFWPMWAVALAMLIPSFAIADDTNFWPMDNIQNGRLDRHDDAIDRITSAIELVQSRLHKLESNRDVRLTPQQVEQLLADIRPANSAIITGLRNEIDRQTVTAGISTTYPKASTPKHPRSPRVVAITAHWCKPCRDSLDDWKAWLEAAGWEINDRDRAHIQVVDIDADPTAMSRWNVTTLPTFIRVEDGEEKTRHVGRASRKDITGLFGNTSNATVAAAAPTPYSEVVRVLGLLPQPTIGFVDFGCGADARWCIAAAEKWPGVRVTGVEIDPARAAAARERVRAAGLDGRIAIITGDATTTDVPADVGVAYLYDDVLAKLVPRIEKMRAFASYIHRPAGVPVVQSGDSWIYTKGTQHPAQVQSRAAVWGGQLYSSPQCNNPRCAMCNSIRAQLSATAAVTLPQNNGGGHYVRRCANGRCWMEWVPN